MSIAKPGTTCAEKIIDRFILNDNPSNFKQSLTELFYEWVQSPNNFDQDERSRILFHYRELLSMLDAIEQFKERRVR